MSHDHETVSSASPKNKRTIGKVTAASASGVGIAGALTTLILWLLSPESVEREVLAVAIATLIMGVGALVGGWLVKPGTGKRAL